MKALNEYSELYQLFRRESLWMAVQDVYKGAPSKRRARMPLYLAMIAILLPISIVLNDNVVRVAGFFFTLLSTILLANDVNEARACYLSRHSSDDIKTAPVLRESYQAARIRRFVNNAVEAGLGGAVADALTLTVALRATRTSNRLVNHPGLQTVATCIVAIVVGMVTIADEKHLSIIINLSALVILLILMISVPSIAIYLNKNIQLNRQNEFERFLRCALLDERVARHRDESKSALLVRRGEATRRGSRRTHRNP